MFVLIYNVNVHKVLLFL